MDYKKGDSIVSFRWKAVNYNDDSEYITNDGFNFNFIYPICICILVILMIYLYEKIMSLTFCGGI